MVNVAGTATIFAKIEKLVHIAFLLTHFLLKLWPKSPWAKAAFLQGPD